MKLKPGVEAKPIRVDAFITEAIDLTDDTVKVLLRLDAVQHRYCTLAYEAGKKAKNAGTEEERQKWLSLPAIMQQYYTAIPLTKNEKKGFAHHYRT